MSGCCKGTNCPCGVKYGPPPSRESPIEKMTRELAENEAKKERSIRIDATLLTLKFVMDAGKGCGSLRAFLSYLEATTPEEVVGEEGSRGN